MPPSSIKGLPAKERMPLLCFLPGGVRKLIPLGPCLSTHLAPESLLCYLRVSRLGSCGLDSLEAQPLEMDFRAWGMYFGPLPPFNSIWLQCHHHTA